MKTVIGLSAFALLLTACGSNSTTATPTSSESPRPAAQQLALGAPFELVTSKSFTTITVSDWQRVTDPNYLMVAKTGTTPYSAMVTAESTGGTWVYDTQYIGLRTKEGDRIDSDPVGLDNDLGTGTLSAGENVRGTVTFEIPQGVTPSQIVLYSTVEGPQAIWNLS